VYSAAKQNPTLSLAWTRHPEVGLPRPDLALFLDISAEDAAKRGGYGTEKYEKKELQDRVRELFGVMMKSQEKEDFVRIDAGPSVEEVQRRIREEVDKAIKKVDDGGLPLGYVESW
jgi:dTMP kinase